jgi:N-acyl-D-amino-acid deacylase
MTILVKNGLVYDGSGNAPEKKDVFIRGRRIVRLGNLAKMNADIVIDGTGQLVTPGFVDINTSSDRYLSVFSEPFQEDFVNQGVTTMIGGNCGISLAPFVGSSFDFLKVWNNPSLININWRSTEDFLKIMKKRGLGLNFGTMVGHETVRRAITRDQQRDLTVPEIAAFKKILEQAFKEGAFGLSVGLNHPYSKGVPYRELRELAGVTAKHRRVLAAHLRDYENDVADSLDEVLFLSKETQVSLEISHLQPFLDFQDKYREVLESIGQASARTKVSFDVCPYDSSVLPAYAFLPRWMQEGTMEEMSERLSSVAARDFILEHLKGFSERETVIGRVNERSLKFLEGRSLASYAESQGLGFERAFLKFLKISKLRSFIFCRNIDRGLLGRFLAHPDSIVASGSASFGRNEFKHERSYSTFTTFLREADRENFLPLEKAVAKITSVPAKKYSIRRRGMIKEGFAADLVVLGDFKPSEVIVNGRLAVRDGKNCKILAGEILKYDSSKQS